MQNPGVGKRFTFYCDEAGNSGLNYLDLAQPLHVVAGWIVPADAELDWVSALAKCASQHRGEELKGKRLLKTPHGRDIATQVLRAGLQHGCLPMSLVVFKDHALSLRAVETFLDPELNPGAEWLPSGADETRKSVATLLWQHAESGVRSFGGAFRTPGEMEWAACCTAIADALESASKSADSTSTELRQAARAFRHATDPATISRIVDAEAASAWGNGKRFEGMSLNFPAFVNLLRHADTVIEGQRGRCKIIHDETLEFEACFRQAVKLFASVGTNDAPLEDGSPARLIPGCFDGFGTRDSKTTIALQAADILASSVYRVGKLSQETLELAEDDVPLAALALGHELILAQEGVARRVPGIGRDDQVVRLHLAAHKAMLRYYQVEPRRVSDCP